MQQADQATIVNTPIASIDLMERAAAKCVESILEERPPANVEFFVFCGTGNNGGDGLVISRMLLGSGFKVNCCILDFSKKHRPDFEVNRKRLEEAGHSPLRITTEGQVPELNDGHWVIDAIFGTGLTRPPEGFVKQVVQKINRSGAKVISIDFPSGLFSKATATDPEAVIRAVLTLTFQQPKLAFLLPSNAEYVGRWQVLDIGLDHDFIDGIDDCPELVDLDFSRRLYRERKRHAHKGSFGHSMIIGGSFGKIGAAILASRAVLKAGGGLASAYIPKCGYTAMQGAAPEVMVEVDDEHFVQFFNFSITPTVIGIGPGLGTHLKTKKGFVDFLRKNEFPMVIDADALNILAEHEEVRDLIPANSILTPHPGEFERLAGAWSDDFEKLEKQQEFARRHACIVVLKGAYTSIASGERLFFNSSGNPALATAGSGDVLTGILTGLLAQGYSSLEASLLGVFLHGRSSDLGVQEQESMESFVASDILKFLGRAFKELGSD